MKKCDGCGKMRADVRSVGRDANGDPDAPDLCFVCVQESKRGRVWSVDFQGYLDSNIGPEDVENKEGLTLQEWLNAAFLGVEGGSKVAWALLPEKERQALVKAWSEGVDPTEYATRK